MAGTVRVGVMRASNRWRGIPNGTLLFVVLGIAIAVGVVAAQGYGWPWDQQVDYRIGHYSLAYALGDGEHFPAGLITADYRYYSPLVQWALQVAERALGLADAHDIYFSRYILSHLFFLAGALACHLLARRLFGSRTLAWFALAFYLLHPRLYAHSFFNSKDTPFLAMFMIGLLLIHRALGKRTVGACALLGAWVGAATSLRPMGAVLLLLALAGLFPIRRRDGRRDWAPAVALLGAAAVAFYACLPYFWGDPLGRVAEWLAFVSDHTHQSVELFMGAPADIRDRPLAYLPGWIAITTPPFVLALAGVGACTWLWRASTAPHDLLGLTRLRFEGLVLVAFVGPALVLVASVGTMYNAWRHAQFLYGPLCLLAAGGLGWLAGRGRRFGACVFGAAGAGLLGVLGAMVLLHPNQQVYFNYLVDRATPDRLWQRYEMDYWQVATHEAYRHLLRAHADSPHGPRSTIPVTGQLGLRVFVLPPHERERFAVSDDFSAFYTLNLRALLRERERTAGTFPPVVHAERIYGSWLYAVARLAVREDDPAGRQFWEHYRAAVATAPLARSRFDVHADGRMLSYVRADCRPDDVQGPFFLHFLDVAAGDKASADSRVWQFWFKHRGVVLRSARTDVCLVRIDLAGQDAGAIRTGQRLPDGDGHAWEVSVDLRQTP